MNIFFEDAHVIVLQKPTDALSEQSGKENGFADTLARENGGYIGVVHRLDRGVGGVMVYAKEADAAAKLSNSIRENRLEKEYLAIVHGDTSAHDGELRDLLFHDRTRNKTFVVDRARRGVKEALLEFRTLATVKDTEYGMLSLLLIKLHTGRTHQIRVQFASRGYPLLGDGKYGAHDRSEIGLFAYRLCFPHPKTNRPVIASTLPCGKSWELFDATAYPTTEQNGSR